MTTFHVTVEITNNTTGRKTVKTSPINAMTPGVASAAALDCMVSGNESGVVLSAVKRWPEAVTRAAIDAADGQPSHF